MTSEVKPDGCRTTETYSDVMENQAGVSERRAAIFPCRMNLLLSDIPHALEANREVLILWLC